MRLRKPQTCMAKTQVTRCLMRRNLQAETGLARANFQL